MKKFITYIILVIMVLTGVLAVGCNEGESDNSDSFDFPSNYTIPELNIDGKDDDEVWATAPVIAVFGKDDAVTVKCYRGDRAIFFYFEVEDSLLLTYGTSNDSKVTQSDSIEFYLDTKCNGGSCAQQDDFQINLGIHGYTRILQGSGSGWGMWSGLVDYEVDLKGGTINDLVADNGYSIEVMVPYSQINIEKDSNLGIAFGHVDKWALPNSAGTAGNHWDWFGWNYANILVEPQNINNYIILKGDNSLSIPFCNLSGRIQNENGDYLSEVTVTVTGEGVEPMTFTSNQYGQFRIIDYPYFIPMTITFSCEGYQDLVVEKDMSTSITDHTDTYLGSFTLIAE